MNTINRKKQKLLKGSTITCFNVDRNEMQIYCNNQFRDFCIVIRNQDGFIISSETKNKLLFCKILDVAEQAGGISFICVKNTIKFTVEFTTAVIVEICV